MIGAGEGAVFLLGNIFGVFVQKFVFEGGLGIFAAVVKSQNEIGENAVFGVLYQFFIDDGIFGAAFEPVVQIFDGDGEFQGEESGGFFFGDGAVVHFVLKGGDLVDGCAVGGVVVGFDAAGGGIGGAHDGAEGVDGGLRVTFFEAADVVDAAEQCFHGFIMFPGVDEAAVD